MTGREEEGKQEEVSKTTTGRDVKRKGQCAWRQYHSSAEVTTEA